MALVQRSCGYADRPTLALSEVERIVRVVRAASRRCLVLVDNCYGEFTEPGEPCSVRSPLYPLSPSSSLRLLDVSARRQRQGAGAVRHVSRGSVRSSGNPPSGGSVPRCGMRSNCKPLQKNNKAPALATEQ